jgi:HlyD family secretion protein
VSPRLPLKGRSLALAGVLVPLLAAFVYVVLRSGPLAAVPVTVTTVEAHPVTPALFGIGTVEARYTYRIGPTVAGRVRRVEVEVGDRVSAGQLLGEMDPVDLDDRVSAQAAALQRAEANVRASEAQVEDVLARAAYAEAQVRRYERLARERTVSEEAVEAKRQEQRVATAGLDAARANLEAARHDLTRIEAERDGLVRQRASLRLLAPVDGLVTARAVDPGTTVVAGQTVVELIDPASLWVDVRFDQLQSAGLRAGLPASVVLRSAAGQAVAGRVLRVEPRADAVTEETLAKVVFDRPPASLPPIGELAEVTVALPVQAARPVVPNASLHRVAGRLGAWVIDDGALRFTPLQAGATDLDGRVQVLDGLRGGERVVVHSRRALDAHSRFQVVERLPGAS